MKKFLLLTALFLVLSNCEIKPRTSISKPSKYSDTFYEGYIHYRFHTEERDGMTFGVWSLSNGHQHSYTGYTVAVVNLTKDALEVELLKLQISELHNKLHKSK